MLSITRYIAGDRWQIAKGPLTQTKARCALLLERGTRAHAMLHPLRGANEVVAHLRDLDPLQVKHCRFACR